MHRLTYLAIEFPRSTLTALAAITIFFASGLPNLRLETGYRVLVGADHPAIKTLEEFVANFGGGLPVIVAWRCGAQQPCSHAFDRKSLAMAHGLRSQLARITGVRGVQGIGNTPLLVPERDGFAVRYFVENGIPVSELEVLVPFALTDPLWVDRLVSRDATVGALYIQPADTRSSTSQILVDAVQDAIEPYRSMGFEFHLAGDAVAEVLSVRDLSESTAHLIPFTVLVIAAILLLFVGSWSAAMAVLATMGIALLWTFGALGWLEWPRDAILEVLAPLIMTVGVCDAVHLLARYFAEAGEFEAPVRHDRERILLRVAREVGPPCLVTTLTTAAAFLSFATSSMDTFVRFGSIAAFGVTVCLILTFALLPILAVFLPVTSSRPKAASKIWEEVLMRLTYLTGTRSRAILVVSGLVFAVSGLGASRLRVDTDFGDTFGESSQIMQWVNFVDTWLPKNNSLEVEVSLPIGVPLEDPSTLKVVENFGRFLSRIEGIEGVTSIVELLTRINRLLHDDAPSFESVGETRGANAQILELVAIDHPELLANWLTLDRSILRISAASHGFSHEARGAIFERVHSYVESSLPRDWSVRYSGQVGVNHSWIEDIRQTQFRSFPVAFLLVLLIVAIFLRSLRLAALAAVPTLLPVVVTLGAMGWMGMSLDIGRAMIAAVVIGIAVDDSVHVLAHYQRRRRAGDPPESAIHAAVIHCGRAVITTSLALALGFLTLAMSAWQTIASFGTFVALAIAVALLASLLVLPALIVAGNPRGSD